MYVGEVCVSYVYGVGSVDGIDGVYVGFTWSVRRTLYDVQCTWCLLKSVYSISATSKWR